MSKKIQLTIAEPCHENWENMNPIEKGKFCGSCQKQVVDFTHMSDRQVAEFFKKPSTGSVCGRFMTDQLHREMEVPKKRIPWVKYFFSIALPAFFISKSAAQDISKSKPVSDTNKVAIPRITLGLVAPKIEEKVACKDTVDFVKGKTAVVKTIPVQGKVTDENGVALSGASVIIKGTKTGVATSNDGSFSLIPDKNWNKIVLVISAIGCEAKEVMVNKKDYATNTVINIGLTTVKYEMMGKISYCEVDKKAVSTNVIPEIIRNADTKTFKAYPNPVVSGTKITIEWKQKTEGYFALQILNLSGQHVHNQEIWIDAKSRSVIAEIPFVSANNYFLVLTDKKTGRKYSEKIIIQ